MSTMERYTDEKAAGVEVEVLPVPVTYVVEPKRPSYLRRFLRVVLAFLGTLLVLNAANHAINYALSSGCPGMMKGGGHHQHPIPPIDNWKPYEGTTHFEFEPEHASGLSIRGTEVFGKVVFETSKLSDKVVIDLDLKTNHHDKNGEVSIEEKDGYLTVTTPSTGKLETYASAKIQIPSNLLGTFGLPTFDLNLPKHMVDYSSLPKSLEIGVFAIKLGKGFVKPGPVHSNNTQITIAKGAIHGSLTQARYETSLDIAQGNVTLDISSISGGNEGVSNIKLGDGHLKGSFPVYNSTTLDVAKGSLYVNVDFESAAEGNRAELSTKVGSGPARVYVDSIAAERLFKSYHTTVSGDQLITYPENFQGTIDARGIAGTVQLEGKDLAVEKVLGGLQGTKGDSERNYVSVKAAKGALDIMVGDE
ncbi:hypothetical protein LTS08_008187 [Lithohypha guttulata]|uniref:Adhesin domain-containing protein n=1 Tax=Lithohypha guttulata TaxID=1690604 RepID=A0AAN7T584_9EURO|nr:hypothetical protein LTR51_006193 [Lithohypha guttulata]KAK5088399.1 hypothetical protein LTR05_002617 [Lithohypha guttulata]KAK5095288.1 hypothetical protein LTS08_008187 [Lithohypha guttulata]